MKYLCSVLLSALLMAACKDKNSEAQANMDIYYTCSMDPQVRENKPGKCPICKMDLTAVKKSRHQNPGEIELSAQQIRLGNIHVDTLDKTTIGDQVILNATLNFDQQKTSVISARIAGRVEKLYYKTIGEFIPKGAKVFEIYNETVNNAKQEYLLTLEKRKTLGNTVINFDQLIEGERNKLLLWGMTEAQINEMAKNNRAMPLTSFYSRDAGFVTSVEISEGDIISEGSGILRMADLSTLWAEVQVYSSQLSGVDMDGRATVQFPDIPGKELKGKIEFSNPEVNPDTRINLLRVSISNEDFKLKPGMAAYVTIKNNQRNTISVPADAVIRGSHGALVWVQTGNNKFKYKMIKPGAENNNRIEVKSGLNSGDMVVVSGAYLLNSEYIFQKGSTPWEAL